MTTTTEPRITFNKKARSIKADFLLATTNDGRDGEERRQYATFTVRYDIGGMNILDALKRHEEALASFDAALAKRANDVSALYNRGNALKALKRYQEALDSYANVLSRQPDHLDARMNSGSVFSVLGRYADALASFDKVLGLRPSHVDALLQRGNVLASLPCAHSESLAAYDRLLALTRSCRSAEQPQRRFVRIRAIRAGLAKQRRGVACAARLCRRPLQPRQCIARARTLGRSRRQLPRCTEPPIRSRRHSQQPRLGSRQAGSPRRGAGKLEPGSRSNRVTSRRCSTAAMHLRI